MAEQTAKYVVAGLDGTGSKEWRRKDGANSHVFRFLKDVVQHGVNGWPNPKATDPVGYWHGPSTNGKETAGIAEAVAEWVVLQTEVLMKVHALPQSAIKVCLVGHSRGCVAAMKAANLLADPKARAYFGRDRVKPPVQIDYLGLYDAVNMTFWGLNRVSIDMPLNNVVSIRHARRKNRNGSPSTRWEFGTVDTGADNTVDFDTSHGGMGGDAGYFVRLDQWDKDYYANALQLIMNQDQLTKEYGYQTAGTVGYMPLGAPGIVKSFPKYAPLSGEARRAQQARVRKSIVEVAAVDNHIRRGAKDAGFVFQQTSTLVQYGDNESGHWTELSGKL